MNDATTLKERLHAKANGGLIAWRCVPLGHRYGTIDETGWRSCTRFGCTARLQAHKRATS